MHGMLLPVYDEMTKWFFYIAFIAMLVPHPSSAQLPDTRTRGFKREFSVLPLPQRDTASTKTAKRNPDDDKKKIKEIAKAKKLPKPEKIEEPTDDAKTKPKRQRRPEGLERPPEIPRRNN